MTYPSQPDEQPCAVPPSPALEPPPSQPSMPQNQSFPPPYGPPPGYAYPMYGPLPYFMPISLPTNPLAVAGLTLGIVSIVIAWIPCMFFFAFITEAVAIILSAVSLNQIAHAPHSPASRGMAIAGLVLGGIALVLTIFVLYAITLATFQTAG